jgi:nitroreductase
MMTRRQVNTGLVAGIATVGISSKTFAQEKIVLPAAIMQGGMPLMSALKARHSTREYSDQPLPLQLLSDLLWAAFGVNRPTGDRTAPYWRHIMVIDVYAVMAEGIWLYEPKSHSLLPHQTGDFRQQTGTQDFVGIAPLNLVYVAHGERMADISSEERRLYASVDAAFVGQNVYLYCASAGLGSVFRGAVDTAALGRAMKLPEGQFVTFAQTVGHPRS